MCAQLTVHECTLKCICMPRKGEEMPVVQTSMRPYESERKQVEQYWANDEAHGGKVEDADSADRWCSCLMRIILWLRGLQWDGRMHGALKHICV